VEGDRRGLQQIQWGAAVSIQSVTCCGSEAMLLMWLCAMCTSPSSKAVTVCS
jgi:hypothetical protein